MASTRLNRSDRRVVYGANCQWWGLIAEAGRKANGLPCCPVCKSVLMEVPDEETWWAGVDAYTKIPNYRQFVEWLRGKCYMSFGDALADFSEETAPDNMEELSAKVKEAVAVAKKEEAEMDLDRAWRIRLSCGHEYINITTVGDFNYMAVRSQEQIACLECNKNQDSRSTNRIMAVAQSAELISAEEWAEITAMNAEKQAIDNGEKP